MPVSGPHENLDMQHAEGQDPENHDRWLVSYADYVTLLFAFFVVLFASSHADQHKARQVADSVKRAYGAPEMKTADVRRPNVGAPVVERGGPKEDDPPMSVQEELGPSYQQISRELADEVNSGKVRIHMQRRGLVVSLQEAAAFEPGDDKVIPGSAQALEKIARALKALPNQVRLEGHTDSVPIHTARFPSNWHLSSARALAMLDYLTRQCGLPIGRFAVAGYSDTVPVDSNETTEGRSHNRRVDIIILAASQRPEDAPSARKQ